jgi:hypothetical protein
MRFRELTESKDNSNFMQILADFLPVAMQEIGLDHLPKIKLVAEVPDTDQPTFGKYDHTNKIIWLGIRQRHPLDIIRTLAHEMVHYRQGVEDKLNVDSGRTGSPEENEAHEVAGIVMRNFNKSHPQYFKSGAVELDENFADGKNPGRKGLAKRSGVNTKASVSSLRKTAKNSSGEKARMAHWLANMKAGRKKHSH